MKTTLEKIAVMQAFAEGAEIEYRNSSGYWHKSMSPTWDWHHFDFKVKKESLCRR